MVRDIIISCIFCFSILHAIAQTNPTWHTTNAPVLNDRYDDISFVNEHLGWAVTFLGGTLLKTTDGGASWDTINSPLGNMYRSVCFVDSLHGFIGKLDTSNINPSDSNFLFKTNDGGNTWSAIMNLPGPRPGGVCGMFHVKDSVIYAVGRYLGPARIYKTTDQGSTWQYIDMSSFATGLVDCYFWSGDSGIVVGDRGGPTHPWDSGGVVLSTFDGGNSWAVRYQNNLRPGICWKTTFPSRKIGYISIQSWDTISQKLFLKTIDGGITWEEKIFSTSSYNAEGIGFLNDSVGWIGGDVNYSYATTDGGNTWVKDTFGIVDLPFTLPFEGTVNRIRFLSDTLGFASGSAIYRYSKEGFAAGVSNTRLPFDNPIEIFPNPANTIINVKFTLSVDAFVKVSIHTFLGQKMLVPLNKYLIAGRQNLEINISSLSSGTYFLLLETADAMTSKKFIINR